MDKRYFWLVANRYTNRGSGGAHSITLTRNVTTMGPKRSTKNESVRPAHIVSDREKRGHRSTTGGEALKHARILVDSVTNVRITSSFFPRSGGVSRLLSRPTPIMEKTTTPTLRKNTRSTYSEPWGIFPTPPAHKGRLLHHECDADILIIGRHTKKTTRTYFSLHTSLASPGQRDMPYI